MGSASATLIRQLLEAEATLLLQRSARRDAAPLERLRLEGEIARLQQNVLDLRRQLLALEQGEPRSR